MLLPVALPGADSGAGAVETVISVPLLMLLILMIAQFAIWEHARGVAQATAEEALAVARVQGGTDAAGQQRAAQVLGQIGSAVLVGPQVSVSRNAADVAVRIRETAERVLPVPGFRWPVAVTVTGPVERFVPATVPDAPASGGEGRAAELSVLGLFRLTAGGEVIARETSSHTPTGLKPRERGSQTVRKGVLSAIMYI